MGNLPLLNGILFSSQYGANSFPLDVFYKPKLKGYFLNFMQVNSFPAFESLVNQF